MGKIGTVRLDSNDMFPEIHLQVVSGDTLTFPEWTGDGYGVILFYRGHW